MTITIDDISHAQVRIVGLVKITPFSCAAALSGVTGSEVWIKFENFLFTASSSTRNNRRIET